VVLAFSCLLCQIFSRPCAGCPFGASEASDNGSRQGRLLVITRMFRPYTILHGVLGGCFCSWVCFCVVVALMA